MINCVSLIAQELGQILDISEIYETEAWGFKDQAAFLNQAIKIETTLDPIQLLDACQEIEASLGKNKTIKWGPRQIDVDILFYDNKIIDSDRLSIPHPQIEHRNFVLIPLNDIGPEYVHPILKTSVTELVLNTKDTAQIAIFQNG